jgi:bacillithiol biosynthesis deacetylase BshB1
VDLDILAISPHPDDVELFCGGTLSGLVGKKHQVGIADLCRGELGSRGSVDTRLREAEAARQVLNVPIRITLGLKDGDLGPSEDNVAKVIEVLRDYRPQWLMCPWKWDRHPDHEDAFRLVRKAVFQGGLVKFQAKGEPFRPRGIMYYPLHWVPQPSFVVDISEDFDRKYQAIACYQSQFYRPDSDDPETYISQPRFLERLKIRDRYWGSQIGTEAGEPWIVERPLGTSDLMAWLEMCCQTGMSGSTIKSKTPNSTHYFGETIS